MPRGNRPKKPGNDQAGRAPDQFDGDDPFIVRALSKGLAMLSLFDAEHRELTLDEMVERLGLPRMTGYRVARTLQSARYLVADPVTGRYHLGPALLASTYLTEGYKELVDIARPYLASLVQLTGESATLAVEIDGVAVCVDMMDSDRPLKREIAVGSIIGDTANAAGKMFAACKPAEERKAIAAAPHPQLTPNTLTDVAALEKVLDEAAAGGVAFDIEERNLGTCAVAAPVRDQMGKVIATVGIVVPAGRFGAKEKQNCAAAVKSTAASLSAFFGYSDASHRED
jgi:DNA-binding IclR family transcriptional regulator